MTTITLPLRKQMQKQGKKLKFHREIPKCEICQAFHLAIKNAKEETEADYYMRQQIAHIKIQHEIS